MVSYYENAKESLKTARKISRSQQRAYSIKLLREQGGVCCICHNPISLQVMGNKSDYVLDHCHETGLVRGVLHRSCNAALGKMENAVGRWGSKTMNMDSIMTFMESALVYYKGGFKSVIYPDHKTEAEKLQAQKLKANKAKALAAAKKRMNQRAVTGP